MDEDVLAATALRLDEAVALGRIEPLTVPLGMPISLDAIAIVER
jgi:hypothetical protein